MVRRSGLYAAVSTLIGFWLRGSGGKSLPEHPGKPDVTAAANYFSKSFAFTLSGITIEPTAIHRTAFGVSFL